MDNIPLVSVIIPVYNCENTIERAVTSVLNQTFRDFELIIVDDGSTDGTKEELNKITDPRIRVIDHERNLGAAAARNTGMRHARGKYIALLDSDDEWLVKKLDLQLEALEKAGFEETKACFTAYYLIEDRGSRTYVPEKPTRKDLFLKCDLSPGSTLLFERELLDIIGYWDETLPRYEDWEWLIRYARKFSFTFVEKPLVKVFHEHGTSVEDIEVAAKLFLNKTHDELCGYGWFFEKKVISNF